MCPPIQINYKLTGKLYHFSFKKFESFKKLFNYFNENGEKLAPLYSCCYFKINDLNCPFNIGCGSVITSFKI